MKNQIQPVAPGRAGRVVRARFGQSSSRVSLDFATWHAHLAGVTGRGTPADGRIVDFDPVGEQARVKGRQSA